MTRSKSAFTLAEVLIVLTIIGIVASLTIPALMQKTQDQEIHTALKKAYSELSQANMRVVADNGGSLKGLCANSDHKCFKNLYLPYLKYVKSCEAPNNDQCISSNILTGCWEYGSSIILADGMAINFYTYDSNCTTGAVSGSSPDACGEVQIDVNGFKPPNQLGKDISEVEFADKNVRFKNKKLNDYYLKN